MSTSGERGRESPLDAFPMERKGKTGPENRLATATAAKAERGDGERIGLDENEQRTASEENYHRGAVFEMPTRPDAGSNCSSETFSNDREKIETTGEESAEKYDSAKTNFDDDDASDAASIVREEEENTKNAVVNFEADSQFSNRDVGGNVATNFDVQQQIERQRHFALTSAAANASGFPNFAAAMYPYGPYFANPFMAPFVAHLPQAQNDDYHETPMSQSRPESAEAGGFNNSYNADFIAQAKYYRELLQQYLRNMESTPASSSTNQESEIGERRLSTASGSIIDHEINSLKAVSSKGGVDDKDANIAYPREVGQSSPKDSSFRADSQSPRNQNLIIRQFEEKEIETEKGEEHVEVKSKSEINNRENIAIGEAVAAENNQLSQTVSGERFELRTLPGQEPTSSVVGEESDKIGQLSAFEDDQSELKSEHSAMVLIKKQISEIEKQILRNSQNQNTRKMDSKEVEAFLLEQQSAFCADVFDANWTAARTGACKQLPQDDSMSGIRQFGASPHQVDSRMNHRTLYEMAAASAMPGYPPPGFVDPYFGQAAPGVVPGVGYPSPMPWQANLFYPNMGVSSAESYNFAHQFNGARAPAGYFSSGGGGGGQLPIYNATIGAYSYAMPQRHVFAPTTAVSTTTTDGQNYSYDVKDKNAQESPMAQSSVMPHVSEEVSRLVPGEITGPSSSSSSSALSSLGGTPFKSIENYRKFNPPRDSASVDSIGSFREANNDDDGGRWVSQDRNSSGHHGDDEDEPVWVLRESYVRKLKREEERKAQKERYETKRLHQENLSSAERALADSDDNETDKLLGVQQQRFGDHKTDGPVDGQKQNQKKPKKKKEVMIHEPAVLIEGVLFRARYLGSTQLSCDGRPTKNTRMSQAQEAVSRIKAADGEHQPFTDVDLFISTEKIMVLNTDLQDIMMDHSLRTISYIADIGDLVVLMARRVSQSSPDSPDLVARRTPRIMCHIFESDEAQFIAQSIGQAFQVAYMEFLRANGIEDTGCLRDVDYQEVLNAQEMFGEELEMFARKETERDVVIPKQKNEILGVVIVESGWGSMLPTVVIANLMPGGPAARSNQLNIGDHIITINGISLVGLPLSECQNHVRNVRHLTAVKLTVVRTAPVVEVRMRRPDTKYQLGFSVQNGVICSLLRGGIGERGGVRVGHRIIEINSQSVVAVPHETVVTILASAVGEIQMKTMPTSMYRLLTGQETPNYL